MSIKHVLIAAALMAAIPAPAAAQVEMGSIPMWNTIGMLNQMSLDRTLGTYDFDDEDEDSGAESAPTRRRARAEVSTLIRLGTPRMPARMAQNYSSAYRDKARRVFGNMLTGYGQVARQLGVPENDVAGAVAAFIAGSWMAYHDRDVADADFPVLVAQMREVLQKTPDFVDASLAEKQDLYEQLAILGTTMALTRAQLKQEPDPVLAAHMQEAAGSYLTGFLKTDLDRMVIDGKGLSFTS